MLYQFLFGVQEPTPCCLYINLAVTLGVGDYFKILNALPGV